MKETAGGRAQEVKALPQAQSPAVCSSVAPSAWLA